jgi:hypothetical protein
MILDITHRLAYGELVNSQRNSTYGWMRLIGSHSSTVLQLTGNGGPSLFGRHIEFEASFDRGERTPHRDTEKQRRMRHYQVGPIGESSLAIDARNPDGSATGELHLEWFGQDGHVVVDQLPVKLRFVRDTPILTEPPRNAQLTDTSSAWRELSELPAFEPVEITSAIFADLLDEMCSGQNDIRIADVIQPVMQLHRTADLSDIDVARHLKSVLASLARHGIALDMCEHFSDRDAYHLLVESLLHEELTYPNLPSVGYVQHLMTHEHCDDCARELDQMLDDI